MRSVDSRCLPFSLALSLAVALSVSASSATDAQSVPGLTLVTSHITEGVVHNRLVSLARAKAPNTTTWVTERRHVEYRGSSAVVQVMTGGVRGHEYTDSLLFYRATLRPIWEHLHGSGMTTVLSFDGAHVTGSVAQKDSATRQINVTTDIPPYSGTIDDVVVQSVPLVSGYRVVLPFIGGGGAVELDTIRVRRRERVPMQKGLRDAWVVDLSYPSGSETLWIDSTTRAIVRHIYTLKDHSQLEVVTS